MNGITYIYALHDPACLGGRIRYIGKADNVAKRYRDHLRHARQGEKSHKANWLRSLFARGLGPQIVTIESVPAVRDWQKIERDYILAHRSAGIPLTNVRTGGEGGMDGCLHTEGTRTKLSIAGMGRRHTEAARAKISAAKSGEKNHNFGKRLSDEIRKKMSAASKGKKKSIGHRANMSAAQLGNKKWTGRKHSLETLARMSASQKGHPVSKQARANMSAAQRLRYSNHANP